MMAGQSADSSAMSITNSANIVLFSCSNEELALIMKWQLAQAKAWEATNEATRLGQEIEDDRSTCYWWCRQYVECCCSRDADLKDRQ